VLDVGPADDADLAAFVDRLAAAGSDRPAALAHARIRRAIAAGVALPGLRRLAEALVEPVAELPPPRWPSEDAGSVVAALRDDALVVLEDYDAAAVAAAVAALLADGKRVLVTGTTPAELVAVRDALPADVADRALDGLPALELRELRELRWLLATSTPTRRARAAQQLPPETVLSPRDEVAQLCAQAVRPRGPSAGAWLIPTLLADLDHKRRGAVTSVARYVHRSLDALYPKAEREWAWALLSDLVHSRHRAAFDRMLEDTAQTAAALAAARCDPPVSFTGAPPPPEAQEVLRRYLDYLEAGGRSRSYFRSAVQLEVQPVLQQVRVGSRVPETESDVRRVIDHLELDERLGRIAADCAETGVPAPRDERELVELAGELVTIAAAARSVGALRHDVLFIAPDSPLSVPGVESAEQIARAIIDYADHGSGVEAGHHLDVMAGALAAQIPGPDMTPEHQRAVDALRERDAAVYAAAVEALQAARREVRDETRCAALLERLSEATPRLATAWTALAEHSPAAPGLASFVPMDTLLSALPPTDSTDVVLVLGAAGLGVERLLVAAVAPRMIAAVGPGELADGAPTLLSVLQRAAAPVIRGRSSTNGQVVAFAAAHARRSAPVPVGQAGA